MFARLFVALLFARCSCEAILDISKDERELLCDAGAAAFPEEHRGPIRWLHVPKTGTSFANTIWHHGCPKLAPDVSIAAFDRAFEQRLAEKYPPKEWCPGFLDHSPGTHKPIGQQEWSNHAGSFVALMREPSARLLSAFECHHHCIKDCNPENNEAFKCDKVRDRQRSQYKVCQEFRAARCPKNYAAHHAAQGCATKMLLGFPCSSNVSLSAEDGAEAVWRLRSGFGFVGLVEEWQLSICLFHRRYGGAPLPVETVHVRSNQIALPASCALDNGRLPDPMDEAVYAAAKEIFQDEVRAALAEIRGSTKGGHALRGRGGARGVLAADA